MKLNFDYLLESIWKALELVRIYTERLGQSPDLEVPVVLSNERNGTTVKSVVENIHKSLLNEFSHAMVWGRSAKFIP